MHGNQTFAVPEAYKRYLSNVFREAFDLFSNPVALEFRTDANPYDRRRDMRKSTSRPDVVDRPTTKGRTGGKAASQTRPGAYVSVKAAPKKKAREASRAPKPGSSRSGKDNRRGPRVRGRDRSSDWQAAAVLTPFLNGRSARSNGEPPRASGDRPAHGSAACRRRA